jgi:hypothetical protein
MICCQPLVDASFVEVVSTACLAPNQFFILGLSLIPGFRLLGTYTVDLIVVIFIIIFINVIVIIAVAILAFIFFIPMHLLLWNV